MVEGILSGFGIVLVSLFKVALFVLSPLLLLVIVMVASFIFFHWLNYAKGSRITKMAKEDIKKKRSIFKRLVIDFPQRFSSDLYDKDPYAFCEQGLHMICGEQGSGKTISVVHLLQEWKSRYPKMKIRTNMSYKYEDEALIHWQQMVQNDNGIYGQVEVIDEIQTWFNSIQSKNFPPEMITEISQQRKQRKCLVGTAQVFSRIAKPIREQTTVVYLPMTLLGCLTIVRKTKPQYWDDEKQCFTRFTGRYFFVHSDAIRNAFDTYLKIEKYREDGMEVRVWSE